MRLLRRYWWIGALALAYWWWKSRPPGVPGGAPQRVPIADVLRG
jgi:hypothetical protein